MSKGNFPVTQNRDTAPLKGSTDNNRVRIAEFISRYVSDQPEEIKTTKIMTIIQFFNTVGLASNL